MDLSAFSRLVKDILGMDREYVIPRFQREYSWGENELSTLWKDILTNLSYTNNQFTSNEYFIGSLVLVGNDTSDSKFQVVDGQQRLTTITILLSALAETFRVSNEISLFNSTFKYIEGRNDEDVPFLRLVNESPKPFLQLRIQAKKKDIAQHPDTEEECKLLDAYNYFLNKLKIPSLKRDISKYFNVQDFNYIDLLKAIRSQILSFKTIYITVANIEQAYTIFETLNAKGKDLEPLDLIKNKIFQVLKNEYPADYALESWKKIKKTLCSRNNTVNISTFYRHFWLSKYSFVNESKLYESFTKKITSSEGCYKEFLSQLLTSTNTYLLITSPLPCDWPRQEDKVVYNSLVALNLFNTTQVRSFLISLLEARSLKKVTQNDFHKIMLTLENFHFVFTAITSSRASNLERIYSRYARLLSASESKTASTVMLNQLTSELRDLTPSYPIFEASFLNLTFTNSITKDKKLIQYIFKKIECFYRTTNELSTYNITLEHILSQSSNLPELGLIGNLLPLDQSINNDIGDISFIDKLPYLRRSELLTVQDFITHYNTKTTWTKDDIIDRSKKLAYLSYHSVWNLF